MNKQTEALKMAIEALEEGFGTLECEGMLPHRYQETIQACKEALAEAEKQEIGEAEIRQMLKEIEWCHQKLEKKENQEPVAKGFIRTLVSVDSNGIEKWKEEPFYTHPATWQSLNDDEIELICGISRDGNFWNLCVDIARAIEQALKELNAKK